MLRTSLPGSITLPGGVTLDKRIHYMPGIGLSRSALIAKIKARGGKYRLVEVLSRNLRGRNDLHGSPYRPSTWILTNLSDVDARPSSSLPKPCENR